MKQNSRASRSASPSGVEGRVEAAIKRDLIAEEVEGDKSVKRAREIKRLGKG